MIVQGVNVGFNGQTLASTDMKNIRILSGLHKNSSIYLNLDEDCPDAGMRKESLYSVLMNSI